MHLGSGWGWSVSGASHPPQSPPPSLRIRFRLGKLESGDGDSGLAADVAALPWVPVVLAACSHWQLLKRNAREEKTQRSCSEATEISLSLPPEVQRWLSSLVGDSCRSGGAPPLSPTPEAAPPPPAGRVPDWTASGVGVAYGCAGIRRSTALVTEARGLWSSARGLRRWLL